MGAGANRIELSASNRGIADHFFCFTCDEYVWDCDHLIEERLYVERVPAFEGSQLQSFAYDGKQRILEIEFRVSVPFVHGELPLPPPPRVVQYCGVPRYIFTGITQRKTARGQERFWADSVRTRFKGQTVRTVCRLPRVFKFSEAKIRRFEFEEYTARMADEQRETFRVIVAAMKLVLLKTLSPRRVSGLGGLLECQGCGSVGPTMHAIRHRNCLWASFRL
jgi:hypothetical protein